MDFSWNKENKEFLTAVRKTIAAHFAKRVISLTYKGKKYFVKRRIGNGRNAFSKQTPATAFWCEAYKINLVNSRLPLAPKIVLYEEDFIVMEDGGETLSHISKEEACQSYREKAFFQAGKSLGRLHAVGLHHGRPALRDIVYEAKSNHITLLDWENEKSFIHAPWDVLDVFLFLQNYFRENFPTTDLLDQFMHGYRSVEESQHILAKLKAFDHQHYKILTACHALVPFGWIDITAVDKARQYIENL